MGYDLERFVGDFAERTESNQRIIDDHCGRRNDVDYKEKSYKVTQMLNSMFGMLIVPYEFIKPHKDDNEILQANNYAKKDKILREANANYYSKLLFLIECLEEEGRLINTYCFDQKHPETKVMTFIEHLRNSLAHGGDTGMYFFPISIYENDGEVSKIKWIIFQDKGKGKEIFIVKLSVQEIEDLSEFLCEIFKMIPSDEKNKKNFKKNADKIHKMFLKNLFGRVLTIKENNIGVWEINKVDNRTLKTQTKAEHMPIAIPVDNYVTDNIGKAVAFVKTSDDEIYAIIGNKNWKVEENSIHKDILGKVVAADITENGKRIITQVDGETQNDIIPAIIVERSNSNRYNGKVIAFINQKDLNDRPIALIGNTNWKIFV